MNLKDHLRLDYFSGLSIQDFLIENNNVKAKIIDGKKIANHLTNSLKEEIGNFIGDFNITPCLAIIMIGNHVASEVYVKNKIIAAKKVGIKTQIHRFDENFVIKDVESLIDRLNHDKQVNGIILQLPLPVKDNNNVIVNSNDLINHISKDKDVDGLTEINIGKLHGTCKPILAPCTALGVLNLIKLIKHDLTGQKITIIGRSNLVGNPLFSLLNNENATCSVCHASTDQEYIKLLSRQSDIVIIATGNPRFFTKEYFTNRQIIIDVGINNIYENNSDILVGDVDFEEVSEIVDYITPVPGGVGPMTVAHLMVNSFLATKIQNIVN